MPEVNWDGSRLFITSSPLAKWFDLHMPGPIVVPRDEVSAISNRAPGLRRGRLLLNTTRGNYSIPYPRAEAGHYADLERHVLAALS